MLAELVDAMKRARDEEEARAVVLTGAGDKVFCAGADLGGFAADAPLVAKHFATDLFPRILQADAAPGQALALRRQRPRARGRDGARPSPATW
jgi:enoyl-CoA hydratase/carnithine racemase